MKDKLITSKEIQQALPFLKGKVGGAIAGAAMSLFGLNKANQLYDRWKHLEGVYFCEALLDDLGVNFEAENIEVLDRFRGQGFVTVSNHPYGHIDGIAAIAKIGAVREDFKVTANLVLGLIDTISMHFIVVNPYKKSEELNAKNISSVKECLEHMENGHPLGFFPAGAVSMPKRKGLSFDVEDGDWKNSTVRIIKKAGVPVIPVYFSGKNSWWYNFLGTISWKLRTLRLVAEMTNKKGKTVRMRFGEPIMPETLDEIKDTKELAAFLKSKTYELAGKCD